MSNIIPIDSNVPAHIANRIGVPSKLADKLAGGITGGGESFPRLSIKGGRFRIKEGDAETVLESTTLDVVIVGSNAHLSKTYYAKAWDPDDGPSAPDCSSRNGVRPDAEVKDPQNDICATCPHNAWGSKKGPKGQDLKACSDSKRLAVVAADDINGSVYLLQITPAALKDLNQYQKELSHRGIAPENVRTRIGFDTNASFPKLKFGFGGWLTEDDIIAVDAVMTKPVIDDVTGEKGSNAPAVPQPTTPPKPQLVHVAEEVAAPAASGFGAAKAEAPKAAAPKAAPKAAAPKVAEASLDNEIADLLAGMDGDD